MPRIRFFINRQWRLWPLWHVVRFCKALEVKRLQTKAIHSRERREVARSLNRLIDHALSEPTRAYHQAVLRMGEAGKPALLVERVRRRATLLARQRAKGRAEVLASRDELILAIYAAATPQGWCVAWCDGSMMEVRDRPCAGIGALLMKPEGEVVARISRPTEASDSFAAEKDALIAVLKAALEQGVERLRVYTDCTGLARLWRTRRSDPRLAPVHALAAELRRFDLREIPRLHNHVAHGLARQAAVKCGAERASSLD